MHVTILIMTLFSVETYVSMHKIRSSLHLSLWTFIVKWRENFLKLQILMYWSYNLDWSKLIIFIIQYSGICFIPCNKLIYASIPLVVFINSFYFIHTILEAIWSILCLFCTYIELTFYTNHTLYMINTYIVLNLCTRIVNRSILYTM